MPIYAYKCGSCGHAKDVLQKISDTPQTKCPACGQESWSKQLSAPGFQLKGTGWYATDFKNGGTAAPAVVPEADKAKTTTETTGAEGKSSADAGTTATGSGAAAPSTPSNPAASGSSVASTPSASTTSVSSTSASGGAGCGASCACH